MPLHRSERCCYPFKRGWHKVKAYVELMLGAFGWKFLLVFAFFQCFVNGILYMAINDTLFPLFKHLGVEPSQVQILSTLSMAPWSMKPLLGVLSDTVSLGRYHKRYWMVLACCVGVVASVVLSTGVREVAVLVAMFFLANFQIAFTDLLIEAKYAELMNKHPETGSNIVTLKTGLQQMGFVVALLFVGPLSDERAFTAIYIIGVCFAASPILLLLFGFLPEEPIRVFRHACSRILSLDTSKVRRHGRLLLVVLGVGLCAPIMSLWVALNPLENVLLGRGLGIGASVVVLAVGVIGGYLSLPRTVANVVLYQVLTSLLSVRVGTALDFFYTAGEECLPGGPHFSYAYYISFTGTLSVIIGLISVVLYQILFSGWRFRNVILLTTALSGLAGVFDLAMVLRWNVALGIPDKAFYIIGESILERVVGMLLWIPSSTIIGKVCPDGMQAVTYAYLAGMSNFARGASSLAGAAIIDIAGLKMQPLVNATNTSLPSSSSSPEGFCNWESLWLLVLLGHVVFRLAVGLPSAFLIPNTLQSDPIEVEEEEESAEEVPLTILSDSLEQWQDIDTEDDLY